MGDMADHLTEHMPFVRDDGGREVAGFKGTAGDCVARAIAIASGRPYREVYDALADGTGAQRVTRGKAKGRTARNGINVTRAWFKRQMSEWGFVWTPTMLIGSGCKVHLVAGELPAGRLVVSVSKHYTAVVDGVVRDTHDPQSRTHWYAPDMTVTRTSERCVYGYWTLAGVAR